MIGEHRFDNIFHAGLSVQNNLEVNVCSPVLELNTVVRAHPHIVAFGNELDFPLFIHEVCQGLCSFREVKAALLFAPLFLVATRAALPMPLYSIQ